MPLILPMRAIVGEQGCEFCKEKGLDCDNTSQPCPHCIDAGVECKRFTLRIAQTCDRCASKKIRCDGNRPCCSQCANVGSECRTSDKRSRRAYPRGHTESLEERVRQLETESGDLKDLLVERDTRTDTPSGTTPSEVTTGFEALQQPTTDTLNSVKTVDQPLHHRDSQVSTLEFTSKGPSQHLEGYNMSRQDIKEWTQSNLILAKDTIAVPSIRLIVAYTPDDTTSKDHKIILEPRQCYEEVRDKLDPALVRLNMSEQVLGTFDRVVFDRFAIKSSFNAADNSYGFIYHIGFGFFSLGYRYFPESKTSIGILLIQNHREMISKIIGDLLSYQSLIGQPDLLPFVAQRAIDAVLKSWFKLQKEAIIEAQRGTGYHDRLALERRKPSVNYTELSEKVTGTAINIVTTELCWEILAEHGTFLINGPNLETVVEELCISAPHQSATADLQNEARRFARNVRMTLLEVKSWELKATIMVQGIFNLIAQQDQDTSIGIARDAKMIAAESKRDSTSMKTIAVVTMTFLPGAFVAAIFSMPIFRWDAMSPKDIVNERFWIYWSLTIPLTLLTFVAWFVWIRSKHDENNVSRWTTKSVEPTEASG